MNFMWPIIFFSLICLFHFLGLVGTEDCQLDIGTGYRQDCLMWETAGPPKGAKINSRLTWKNIQIWEVQAHFRAVSRENLYVALCGSFGWVFNGKNRDSDYTKYNGQVYEYSRSEHQAGKGYVYDASTAVGYVFRRCLGPLQFIPLVGYSWNTQQFHMYKGRQRIDLINRGPQKNPFGNLNSYFRARWSGPWLGGVGYWEQGNCLLWRGQFEYHWAEYKGRGHWNLRSDIAGNFRQSGYGEGFLLSLGLNYRFCTNWYVEALGRYQQMRVDGGHDKVWVDAKYLKSTKKLPLKRFSDGKVCALVTGRVRRVHWNTFAVGITLGSYF